MIKLLCTKDKEPTGFLIQDATEWEAMYNTNVILKEIEVGDDAPTFYLFKHNEMGEDTEEVSDWYLMHEDHLYKVLWEEAQLKNIFDYNRSRRSYLAVNEEDLYYKRFSGKSYYINTESKYLH